MQLGQPQLRFSRVSNRSKTVVTSGCSRMALYLLMSGNLQIKETTKLLRPLHRSVAGDFRAPCSVSEERKLMRGCVVITWLWYSMPMLMLLSIMATRMARWTCWLSTKLLMHRLSLLTRPPESPASAAAAAVYSIHPASVITPATYVTPSS